MGAAVKLTNTLLIVSTVVGVITGIAILRMNAREIEDRTSEPVGSNPISRFVDDVMKNITGNPNATLGTTVFDFFNPPEAMPTAPPKGNGVEPVASQFRFPSAGVVAGPLDDRLFVDPTPRQVTEGDPFFGPFGVGGA